MKLIAYLCTSRGQECMRFYTHAHTPYWYGAQARGQHLYLIQHTLFLSVFNSTKSGSENAFTQNQLKREITSILFFVEKKSVLKQ